MAALKACPNGEVNIEDEKETKLKEEESDDEARHLFLMEKVKSEAASSTTSPPNSTTSSPRTYLEEGEGKLVNETVTMEPHQPAKLVRTASHKTLARSVPPFNHNDDKTNEATKGFEIIADCTYASKSLGSTEHAMDCDCIEEWDATSKSNHACGEESDCINRATKMECVGDCGCGPDCQNQRFQQRQYAQVSVIQTEKKGFGLRSNTDLLPGQFVFEYIGEVINEAQFRRRTIQYDDEGIKHFYFMSLSKGEFVDATRRGNLGRFCNHSCNPNCFVDKWVVGEKLRMGIFAEREIRAGEELVFNYNVDRYGADPQPCYCGESNCSGFLGGKTQTERATKLSNATIAALGIDDPDTWDTTVAKRPRKKKLAEDDEDYVSSMQSKSLDEEDVTKVMATLMQCKEKWIAVRLLDRIQRCDEERVISRVVKMHGYQILNAVLGTWREDFNVVLQILDILNHFPRITKNKITDSKIESTVRALIQSTDDRVQSQSTALLLEWSTLETAYRIPRKKRDPNAGPDTPNHFERREAAREDRKRSRSRSPSHARSIDAPRGPAIPSGPRNSGPARNGTFFQGPRPPFRPRNTLPFGWFAAMDEAKKQTYYYTAAGQTTWTRPTVPAAQPPPPPKPVNANKALDDIINSITSAKAKEAAKVSEDATPLAEPAVASPKQKSETERWRTYSEEKQKRLYEHTLHPPIKHVMDKYRNKLPREDLKRFAKEISKKLVNSDFKRGRVDDPSKISAKHEHVVKKFVREFFDKAVVKRKEYDRKKAEKRAKAEAPTNDEAEMPSPAAKGDGDSDGEEMTLGISDDDASKKECLDETPITPLEQIPAGDKFKRKRSSDDAANEGDATPSKRARSDTPPPPPPPPPPIDISGTIDVPMEDTMEDSTTYDHDSSINSPFPINGTDIDTAPSTADVSISCGNHLLPSLCSPSPPPPPPPPPPIEVLDSNDRAFAENADGEDCFALQLPDRVLGHASKAETLGMEAAGIATPGLETLSATSRGATPAARD